MTSVARRSVEKLLNAKRVARCGDGTVFCSRCADACCASASIKETIKISADAVLLNKALDWGVFTDIDQWAHERPIQSMTVRSILTRVIADAQGVKAILDAADDAYPRKAPRGLGPRRTAPGSESVGPTRLTPDDSHDDDDE